MEQPRVLWPMYLRQVLTLLQKLRSWGYHDRVRWFCQLVRCNHMTIHVEQKTSALAPARRSKEQAGLQWRFAAWDSWAKMEGNKPASNSIGPQSVIVLINQNLHATHCVDLRSNSSEEWLLAALCGMFCTTNPTFGITHWKMWRYQRLWPDLHWLLLNLMQMPLQFYLRNQPSSNFTSSVLASFSFFTSGLSPLHSKTVAWGYPLVLGGELAYGP